MFRLILSVTSSPSERLSFVCVFCFITLPIYSGSGGGLNTRQIFLVGVTGNCILHIFQKLNHAPASTTTALIFLLAARILTRCNLGAVAGAISMALGRLPPCSFPFHALTALTPSQANSLPPNRKTKSLKRTSNLKKRNTSNSTVRWRRCRCCLVRFVPFAAHLCSGARVVHQVWSGGRTAGQSGQEYQQQ